MKILITGGAGFIGSALARKLAAGGHEIVVIDDLSTGNPGGPAAPCNFVKGSILDRRLVASISQDVDFVLHLASVVGKVRAFLEPDLAYQVATEGTDNVLWATPGVPTIAFSSSAVYGVDDLGPVREDLLYLDRRAREYDGGKFGYACGKLAMERIVLASGCRSCIVRPFNVVGVGQVGQYGMVLPRFVRQARSERPIQIYGDGSQTRSFSDIDRFVAVISELVDDMTGQSRRKYDDCPIVNVGAPQGTAIRQLAELVSHAHGRDPVFEFVPYDTIFPGQQDVRGRVPDTSYLESLIGPVQWPSIKEVVEKVCRSSK